MYSIFNLTEGALVSSILSYLNCLECLPLLCKMSSLPVYKLVFFYMECHFTFIDDIFPSLLHTVYVMLIGRCVVSLLNIGYLFRFCLVDSAFLPGLPRRLFSLVLCLCGIITDLIMKMSSPAFDFSHQMLHIF